MFLIFNGELRSEEELLIRADNRGFRYGDGLFETMLVRYGSVRLGSYHLERLSAGMRLLQLQLPEPFSLDMVEQQISEVCAHNSLQGDCRARLTVFRAASGMYNVPDSRADCLLQVSGLAMSGTRDLILGVYPHGRKTCDALAAIKSNSYLLSSLAGIYAKDRGWDDCLLLNSHGRVAETAAANIWWTLRNCFFTPPLTEGCVPGVMRRFLLEALPQAGYEVRQEPIGPEALADAEEIFISNAIRGVQGISVFGERRYDRQLSAKIQTNLIDPMVSR